MPEWTSGNGLRTKHSIFVDYKPNYSLDDFDVTLDACGAPHFAISTLDLTVYNWDLEYVRWTAAGWRSSDVYLTLDPQGAAIGVGPSGAEIIFYGGIINGSDSPSLGIASIPQK